MAGGWVGTDPLVFCFTAARQLCVMNEHWGVLGGVEERVHWTFLNCSWLLAQVTLDFATCVPWDLDCLSNSRWRRWSGKCSQGSGGEVHAEQTYGSSPRAGSLCPWATASQNAAEQPGVHGKATLQTPVCTRAQPVWQLSCSKDTSFALDLLCYTVDMLRGWIMGIQIYNLEFKKKDGLLNAWSTSKHRGVSCLLWGSAGCEAAVSGIQL